MLKYRFRQKLNNLFLVYANTQKIGGIEHFHYNEAYLCQKVDTRNLKRLFKQAKIVVEPRCHMFLSTGKLRDRGVAYRMQGEHLKALYSNVERIV